MKYYAVFSHHGNVWLQRPGDMQAPKMPNGKPPGVLSVASLEDAQKLADRSMSAPGQYCSVFEAIEVRSTATPPITVEKL